MYHIKVAIILVIISHNVIAQPVFDKASPALRFNHLSESDGLAENRVWAALKDRNGFMWFGTPSGISRYDGYSFKNYKLFIADRDTISGAMIVDILEDNEGYLWLASLGDGVIRFDPKHEKSEIYRNDAGKALQVASNAINCLHLDKENNLWLGTYSTGLLKLDTERKEFKAFNLFQNSIISTDAYKLNTIHDIEAEYGNENILWLATNNGLYRFDKKSGDMDHYPSLAPNTSGMSCHTLYAQRSGLIWVGTYSGGLVEFNTHKKLWNYFPHNKKEWDKRNTSKNIVLNVQPKSAEELWLCTEDQGLLIFNTNTQSFSSIPVSPNDPYAIPEKGIRKIYVDTRNVVWVLNKNKGISMANPNKVFFHYAPIQSNLCKAGQSNYINDFAWEPTRKRLFVTSEGCEGLYAFDENNQQIPNMLRPAYENAEYEFYSLYVDRNGAVWLGGRHYIWHNSKMTLQPSLWVLRPDTDQFIPFQHPQFQGSAFSVLDISEDSKGVLWLATQGGGLVRIDERQNEVRQYVQSVAHPDWIDADNRIVKFVEDEKNNLWLATETQGLIRFDPREETFSSFPLDPTGKYGIMEPQLTSVERDADGNIWVGCKSKGIQIINPDKWNNNPIRHLGLENGLPNKRIVKIRKDAKHDMWISTEGGLARYRFDGQGIAAFSTNDGLDETYLLGLGLSVAENGRMYIGQQNGFYRFEPNQLHKTDSMPSIVLTDFRVSEDRWHFDQQINYLEEVTLDYANNFFSIEFALLDYQPLSKKQYAYALKGYDDDWISPANGRNTASYTNVGEGSYEFVVQAIDPFDNDLRSQRLLSIHVMPPWYRSWWAYTFYGLSGFLLIGGIVAAIHRIQLHRIAMQETHRLKELDQFKSRFFANISHEFRTPLTVIMGMVEEIKGFAKHKEIIIRNSQKLLHLINQLLDLSKLEAKSLKLQAGKENIIDILALAYASFETLADSNNIAFELFSQQESIEAYVDREKLDTILTNLLGNAFKFTPNGGKVFLWANTIPVQNIDVPNSIWRAPASHCLILTVRDSGIGISPEHLPHIFDRFYQADSSDSRLYQGTGIGLALVKELVQLHHGHILARSEPGEGSTFEVLLPLGKGHLNQDELILRRSNSVSQAAAISNFPNLSEPDRILSDSLQAYGVSEDGIPVVLIVEDNFDMQTYIAEALHTKYRLLQASNGEEGLAIAKEEMPDLIISDVMMPKMDGRKLCNALKTDRRTSHIPVILLTAKAGEEAKIEGLVIGADEYMVKPFSPKELDVRIKNLIAQRVRLRHLFGQNMLLTPKEIAFTPADTSFLKSTIELIEEHIADEAFSVATLTKALDMSRQQVHRKIKALTDQSPSVFIRTLRLKRAAQLLKQAHITVAEAMHQSGFSNHSYFSKCFKEEFELSPSDYHAKYAE